MFGYIRKTLKSTRTLLNTARDDFFHMQTSVYTRKVDIASFTLMYVNRQGSYKIVRNGHYTIREKTRVK